jgi:hypothetical protein
VLEHTYQLQDEASLMIAEQGTDLSIAAPCYHYLKKKKQKKKQKQKQKKTVASFILGLWVI